MTFEEVWQQACDAQKKVCAEHAKTYDDHYRGRITVRIDKDSILNAPTAINPHKK